MIRRWLPSALAVVIGLCGSVPLGVAQSQPKPKPKIPAAAAPRSSALDIPRIRHERYTLPNGLTVILVEDHAVPLVALTVWYHVGSKNEKPGRTGFAHLFEHVMFQGSEHVANDAHFKIIEEAGGDGH